MSVTRDKFVNRLIAYVHQKGLAGTRGKFLRDEFERLGTSIRSLVAVQSEGHNPMDQGDARTTAIFTYLILGELAARTDMQPIENYGLPAATVTRRRPASKRERGLATGVQPEQASAAVEGPA